MKFGIGRVSRSATPLIRDHDDAALTTNELAEVIRSDPASEVIGFAPPGDIHQVTDTNDSTAISIHSYGTDVTRAGSSVRRYYD